MARCRRPGQAGRWLPRPTAPSIEFHSIWHHTCASLLSGARNTRMEFQDYYDTLGVSRKATDAEIKAAYRKLARQFHPDRNTDAGAEDRFKAVSEAYEVLKDPEKRQQYDALGANWQNGQQFRPPPGWDGGAGSDFGGASGFSDFFETLFGQGFQAGDFGGQNPFGGRPSRPSPQSARITVTLEDVFNGAKRRLTLNDSGGPRQVDVQIPKGVRPGQKIRLSGQGRAGMGGLRGDLLLEIDVQSHPVFELDGRDVRVTVPITPWEAGLGSKLEVPTLAGTVTLKVPAAARTGQTLRLRGRGLPGNPPGDQLVSLQIQTPPAKTKEEKAFYEKMAAAFSFNPRREHGQA